MKKVFLSRSLIALIILAGFISCNKKYDLPPVKTQANSPAISIKQIKAKFKGEDSIYRFAADSSLYCTVTADETSGNLYKTIYVQDSTGAIVLKLLNSSNGRLFIGDNIRINLKSITLNDYGSVIQLDSVDIDKHIVKQSSGTVVTPLIVTIDQIMANSAATNALQSRLVKIENVEFKKEERGLTYADPVGKATKERVMYSCSNTTKTLVVRSSGYANYAGSKVPSGNGSIICIISQYRNQPNSAKTNFQLILRNPLTDVDMNGTPCNTSGGGGTTTVTPPSGPIHFSEDFGSSSLVTNVWTNVNVIGSVNWSIGTSTAVATKPYVQANGYFSGANHASETWLISKAIDLSPATNPMFSFANAYNYTGDPLKCYVSTDYTSGAPSTATWTELSFTASTGGFKFVSSGYINLSSYKSTNTRIAFKYTSTNTSGSHWELDNIVIQEQ